MDLQIKIVPAGEHSAIANHQSRVIVIVHQLQIQRRAPLAKVRVTDQGQISGKLAQVIATVQHRVKLAQVIATVQHKVKLARTTVMVQQLRGQQARAIGQVRLQ